MIRRVVICSVLAASALLSGCATWYHVHPGNLQPSFAMVSAEQRSVLWRRAVTVLLDQGYVPQVLNEAAWYINAKRREDIADDAFVGTTALFSISLEGRVRVEVSGAGLFRSEKQFLTAVGQRQEMLLDQIMNPSTEPHPAR
jgi:hypothetical protein